MRWYEYKMEADELHVPEDLKAKLLAMTDQLTEEEKNQPMMPRPVSAAPAQPERREPKKKLIRFPAKQAGLLAACLAVCVVGYGALNTGMLSMGAKSSNVMEYSAASVPALGAADRSTVDLDGTEYGYGLENSANTAAGALSAGDAAPVEDRSVADSTKIIYTASLTLESRDYDEARQTLDQALTAAGGYLESGSEYTRADSARSASLTCRVPSDNYQSFLEAAAAAGRVTYKSQDAEDVTTQYMDVEARLANLEARRTRLQQLQQQAESLADLLEIESSLSDVQYQIESWQSQLDWYSDQVRQCTVNISLNEVETYSPEIESFGARLAAALSNGWSAFVEALQELAVILLYLLPVLVIAAVVLAVVLVRRKKKKK